MKTERLIFVASMDSEANHDGAIYFVREIFSLVKAPRPSATVVFVGRNPRKELLDLHDAKGIIVTGKVADVFAYYNEAALAVVPLRSGGGTRLKILEAMAAGVPVVSTGIGCEGLNLRDGEHLLIADTPRRFTDCIIRLLDDESFRGEMIRKARALVENEYDWALIARKQVQVYRSVAAMTHA
jgi:glycosyltransferase involved in cell wall biosynthesis